MILAFGMVIVPQNLSTENGQIPGWSCILSVASHVTAPVSKWVLTLALEQNPGSNDLQALALQVRSGTEKLTKTLI